MLSKDEKILLRLGKCSLHIFDAIYQDKAKLTPEERKADIDFIPMFDLIKNVTMVLSNVFQKIFQKIIFEQEESLVDQLLSILQNYYLEGDEIIEPYKQVKTEGNKEFLRSPTDELWIYATSAIKYLTKSQKNARKVLEKDGMQTLCKVLQKSSHSTDHSNYTLQIEVTESLRNLLLGEPEVEILLENGALAPVSRLINSQKTK